MVDFCLVLVFVGVLLRLCYLMCLWSVGLLLVFYIVCFVGFVFGGSISLMSLYFCRIEVGFF